MNERKTLSLTIQRTTINDLETLCRIERECFIQEAFNKQQIVSLLENPNAVSLTAKIDNLIAGFVIGLIHRHDEEIVGHVYTLDVAVKYRRKSVGIKLLDEIERIFEKRGVKLCYLEARKDNLAALELYHKHGYVKMKELRDYYKDTHGVQLRKKIRK